MLLHVPSIRYSPTPQHTVLVCLRVRACVGQGLLALKSDSNMMAATALHTKQTKTCANLLGGGYEGQGGAGGSEVGRAGDANRVCSDASAFGSDSHVIGGAGGGRGGEWEEGRYEVRGLGRKGEGGK